MIGNKALCLIVTLLTIGSTFNLIQTSELSVYNRDQSREYAILAISAECPKKCLEEWNCGDAKQFPLVNVTHFNNAVSLAAAYAGYRVDTNQIVVAFRGSVNIQNWIEDFTFDLVKYEACEGCKIHLGFFEDYKLIEAKINEKVIGLRAKYPTASILSTGYSLGAALSLVAGLRLKEKFPTANLFVHNFGQPRIGNKALAAYAHKTVDGMYRVVHNRDLVPHLPFESMDFRHTAYEVFYDEKMTNYKVCNESGEDGSCSNHFDPAYNPGDHKFYFLHTLKC